MRMVSSRLREYAMITIKAPTAPCAIVSWRHRVLRLALGCCMPAVVFASQVSVSPLGSGECGNNVSDATRITCFAASNDGFSGFAEAQAGSGQLHAEALAVYSFPAGDYYTPLGGGTLALADYFDTFSLANAPGQGFLFFQFFVHGSLSLDTTVGGDVYAGLSIEANGQAYPVWSANQGQIATSASVRIPYSGSLVTTDLQLISEAGCGTGSALDPLGSCLASVHFEDTASVVGLGVLDLSGNVVPNASIAASSGYSYPALISSVPEPASIWLLLGGLAVILLSAKSVRRRCST